MAYVDRYEILKHKRKMKGFGISQEDDFWDYAVLEEDITNAPTADVVEVKHGEWEKVKGKDYWTCSNCCTVTQNNEDEYCRHCGAKMDGGNNG